jgi:hypothetical protein
MPGRASRKTAPHPVVAVTGIKAILQQVLLPRQPQQKRRRRNPLGSVADDEARQRARVMSNDEWQRFTAAEMAKAVGRWLEERGRLGRPIHSLTLQDLEGMAETAVARFVVLNSLRLKECKAQAKDLAWMLAG